MKTTVTRLYVLCFFCITAVPLFAQIPYADLPTDIAWTGAQITVSDIAAAFENARTGENTQLGTTISTSLDMPEQGVWDDMSISEKALFLINAERVARSLLPLEGVSSNIVTIAQKYTDYLQSNNLFGHTAGGTTPTSRLNEDGAINGCSESGFIYGPENIANYGSTTSDPTPLPVERAVYGWIYEDSGQTWGHRRACFALFNNNFGSAESEGFMGIGLSEGSYKYFGDEFPYGAVVVYDFVDPCPTSTLP